MFIIKRTDAKATNKTAQYEVTAYATIGEIYEQLHKLGCKEQSYNFVKEEFYDAAPGEIILTASNSKGQSYEVRALGLYGYDWQQENVITEIIRGLKNNARFLNIVRTMVRKVNA